MEPDARFLASARGSALLDAARATRGLAAHRRPERLRGLGSPAEVRAALAQDDLRRRAASKTPDAERLLFHPDALEQATPWPVALERAGRWPGPPDAPLHDLGAGVGLDALAAATTGRPVVAWERDEGRALLLEHNARVLGLSDRVHVERRDFLAERPSGPLAFLDPDRRPGGRRTREPESFDPPASAWPAILARFDAGIVKAPPVSSVHEDRPFEVVSLAGSLRERRLFFGAFEGLPPRRALRLPDGASVSGSGLAWPEPAEVHEGDWLLDPDPSVTVADLVGDLAAQRGLRPVHPRIAYLVGPRSDAPTPGTWLRVDALLPARPREVDAWLDARQIGSLTIRSRGVSDTVDSWRRRLSPRGPLAGTIVLFRDLTDRWRAVGSIAGS